MSKSLVYTAGPLLNCSEVDAMAWRWEVKKLLGEKHVLNPADRYWAKDEKDFTPEQDRDLVDGDLALLDQCDAVIWRAWKASFGASMEAMYAHLNRKLLVVVAVNPESAWVRRFADFRTESVAEACRWVANSLRMEDAPCLK